MDASAIHPQLQAADVPLEQLVHNSHLTEEQKINEATRQFEAVLLRQILAETQKTVIASSYSDNSTAASIYHDMVTKQLADSISKSGTLGLARTLQAQLSHQAHPASSAGHDRKPEALPTAQSGVDVARPHSESVNARSNATHLKPLPNRADVLTSHE
jgi:flagellar protein FlgJ